MELWVILAVAAAVAQSLRFALQKSLASGTLSPAAATWARFLWSAPVVIATLILYLAATGQRLPAATASFLTYATIGGLSQILATVCTIALFRRRAFAVGITFKKTEVMLTALAGLVILGDTISTVGTVAIAAGFIGVLLLSDPPEGGSPVNAGAALGLASGVFFALSAVTYRGATLALDGSDVAITAGMTLAVVTVLQTLILGFWLALFEPGQIGATLRNWKKSSLVSLFSLIGSFCWFAAFSLKNAAYVFAVGQVELIFSLIIGRIAFFETPNRRELLGIAVLTVSILMIALVG